MPTSKDPVKRARQLANLKRGNNPVPGNGNALAHGARTTQPQRSPEWSPAVMASIADLEQRVHHSLRDADGRLWPWAVLSVEAVAVLRVSMARIDRFCADAEARGKLKPEDVERQANIAAKYHASLERESLTLRSRLETMKAGLDAATALAAAREEQDPAIRRAILKAAGIEVEDGPGVSIGAERGVDVGDA